MSSRTSRSSKRGLVPPLILAILAFLVPTTPAIAAGDATTAPGQACPNEASPGFRSYLPECRAYEQVTPVFKDGTEPEAADLAEDGSRLLTESLGVFAGSGSDTELHGSVYELSRSQSGWGISAISPPTPSFPAQRLLAASPELGDTLWLARSPTESLASANFYVRESDGVMVELGSALPPTATSGPPAGQSESFLDSKEIKFAAASDDFSHVVFDLLDGSHSWPGDTTSGARSLYEYSGTGQGRPELIGVNSEGHLISSCETYLGSQSEQDLYNAVSASGSTVFFTAEACSHHPGEPSVNELYARLGAFPIDTVPISEPTVQACEECQTGVATFKHPAVAEQPAEYAGASENGSSVFFTTIQELLPGASGENLYDYDFENPDGHKVVRVSIGSEDPEVQGVVRVSEDGSHVYFVARGVLSREAREGEDGNCLAELGSAEKIEEEEKAQNNETKEAEEKAGAHGPAHEPPGTRCRPRLGGDNLYVYERDASHPAGSVTFVATLCSGKEVSGSLSDFSQCPSALGDTADWAEKDQRTAQATPDGRFLLFESVANLTAGDISEEPQLFEYGGATESLVRVSTGADDYRQPGTESADKYQSMFPPQGYASEKVSPAAPGSSLAISDNGATVVFESSASLTTDADPASHLTEAGSANVYEYHSAVAEDGSIANGNVYLLSDGANRLPVTLVGLDASGEDVFFKTADRLVPQDTDTQFDIYDARVDGGFSAPDPPGGCEECEASPLVQPLAQAQAGGTAGGDGSGGVVQAGVPVPGGAGLVARRGGETPAEKRAVALEKALKTCRKIRSRTSRLVCEKRAKAKKANSVRRTRR